MSNVRRGMGGTLPLGLLGPSAALTRLVDEGGLSPPRSTRGLGGMKRPEAAEPARERGGIINCASGASSSESESEDEASVVLDREAV